MPRWNFLDNVVEGLVDLSDAVVVRTPRINGRQLRLREVVFDKGVSRKT